MNDATKIVAFIPARKGSKRLPNKNVLPFHGKPMVWWAIDYARKAEVFDQIILSTDNEDLINDTDSDVTVCRRPQSLANDTATILETIVHTGNELGLDDETIVVVLMVTGLLRVKSDLVEGLRLFKCHNKTIVSVSPQSTPPALLWEMDGDAHLTSLASKRDPAYTRKQNHPHTYRSNDILVIDSFGGFCQSDRDLFGFDPIGLLVPSERDMPIDEPYQFCIAEFLFPPTDERV